MTGTTSWPPLEWTCVGCKKEFRRDLSTAKDSPVAVRNERGRIVGSVCQKCYDAEAMAAQGPLKFRNTDEGFCRVYYTHEAGAVYCWQLDRPGRFIFLRCSRDGEPSHEVRGWGGVPALNLTPLPKFERGIGKELVDFITRERGTP